MTSAIGNVSSAQGGVVFTPASSTATPASSGFATQAATGPLPTAANVHNPVVIDDPAAGIITQYLSQNGSQVIAQNPSAASVAYLKQGLTADGTPKAVAAEAGTVTV